MAEIIFPFNNDDQMKNAQNRAIKTFKYCWRELSWESRRIIPGLDLYAVKKAFKTTSTKSDALEYEQMWLNEISFDGDRLSASLLNDPNWIEGVSAGDRFEFKLEEISDWMYAIYGKVYGAFSVQTMRIKMSAAERKSHDDAWGLDFGDPSQVFIVPMEKKAWWKKIGSKAGYEESDDIPEHPMSENMAEKIEAALKKDPSPYLMVNESGSTMLHYESLAGNLSPVRLLLKYGANRNIKDGNGHTPLQLAEKMKWDRIIEILKS